MGGIAIGIAVMILSIAIVTGYQQEVRKKVSGFGAHVQISNYDTNSALEQTPIDGNHATLKTLDRIPNVRHTQIYGLKAGIIQAEDEIQGIVLKGVDKNYDWNFFKQHIKEGKHFVLNDTSANKEVLISRYIANRMKLKVGDKIRMFFIQENNQRRKAFHVAGIYETSLEGFDNIYVYADLSVVRNLNGWENGEISGMEILLEDYNKLDETTEAINEHLASGAVQTSNDQQQTTLSYLKASSIKELFPQIFSWLDYMDLNANLVIVLMLFVSVVNMTSALLILILERTKMIGVMKAMGAANKMIRNIFLINAGYLIGKGLLIGNAVALALALIQKQTGLIKLDQETYYLPVVPVNIDVLSILVINAGTLIICMIALLLPSMIVSRIHPVKAIRFS